MLNSLPLQAAMRGLSRRAARIVWLLAVAEGFMQSTFKTRFATIGPKNGVRRPPTPAPRLRAAEGAAEVVSGTLSSICMIFATCVEPDYLQPWSQYAEEDVTGSGFVVTDAAGGPRILTNEHVVRHARDVRVRPHGSARKFKCSVAYASPERDLALLSVDDDAFWETTLAAPLPFAADLPRLFSDVTVVGYPMGGDNVCVTRGVVSRLDAMAYGSGRGEKLVVVQIDAAINSGNSGGPALDGDGNVVGVAFSGFAGEADNIGYVIPACVAENFLLDAAAGGDGEVCSLGLAAQPAANPALRRRLGLVDGDGGVLITRVAAGSAAKGAVRVGDVLLSVAGSAVADDGTVALRGAERIDVSHAFTAKRDGDVVDVEVLRDGERVSSAVRLHPLRRLVPLHPRTASPTFAILGGLVLMPLTTQLVDAVAHENDVHVECGVDGEAYGDAGGASELVVWASTLTSDANYGYAHLSAALPRLVAVNGVAPHSLAHALELCKGLHRSGAEFYDLKFADPGSTEASSVVLDIDDVDDGDLDLMLRNNLPDLCSRDVADAYYDAPPVTQKREPKKRRAGRRKRR